MSDNAAIAEAVYPGGPNTAPAAPPAAAPARAAAPAPAAAAAPAAEPAAAAATDTEETTPTLLTEKEEPEKPAEEAPAPFDAEKITLPEGMKPDAEILGKFGEIATKHKVSQEAAQELVNLYHSVAGAQAKQNWDSWQTTQSGWVADVKADREIGNLDEVKRTVGRFLDDPAFAGPKTREGFEVTGSGNHPEVIRFIYRLTKALAEGTHVAGNGPVRQATERSLAERLYPNLAER
jgi:hypothetical protein